MKIVAMFVLCVSFLFASVDINKASQDELVTLSGIGDKKAKDILSFRTEHGCFKSIEDLEKVKGIGPKIIEKNRQNITLSECK